MGLYDALKRNVPAVQMADNLVQGQPIMPGNPAAPTPVDPAAGTYPGPMSQAMAQMPPPEQAMPMIAPPQPQPEQQQVPQLDPAKLKQFKPFG